MTILQQTEEVLQMERVMQRKLQIELQTYDNEIPDRVTYIPKYIDTTPSRSVWSIIRENIMALRC